jgi:hypothetical protein
MTVLQARSRRTGQSSTPAASATNAQDRAARQRREAARARDLAALLQHRPDLAGVHPPADFAAEALRWCV